jgi:CRP/FNR family transcriptional regulator, cyclic AMP receptor protein
VSGGLRSLSVFLAAPLPAREFQMTPQDLLRLHPFFSALPLADIDNLLTRTRRRRVLADKVLFEKDAPGDGLYGVLSGRIVFTVDSADGKQLTLNVLGSGEFFGEIALLDGKGRSAAATAREASELLFIPRNEFLSFVRERPDMMLHIMAVVCGRLRRSTDYIADAAFLDLSTRLAKQLVVLLDGNGASLPARLHISHAELASMLGASRERVTRLLAAWGDKGILDQGRGRLVVRDPRALEQLVDDG